MSKEKPTLGRFFRPLGPGLVMGAADDDPSRRLFLLPVKRTPLTNCRQAVKSLLAV